jgi:hypothetical protein
MADAPSLLMLVGAATPPGRLAAAIAVAAEAARTDDAVAAAEILNLAETPIDTCDGLSRGRCHWRRNSRR